MADDVDVLTGLARLDVGGAHGGHVKRDLCRRKGPRRGGQHLAGILRDPTHMDWG